MLVSNSEFSSFCGSWIHSGPFLLLGLESSSAWLRCLCLDCLLFCVSWLSSGGWDGADGWFCMEICPVAISRMLPICRRLPVGQQPGGQSSAQITAAHHPLLNPPGLAVKIQGTDCRRFLLSFMKPVQMKTFLSPVRVLASSLDQNDHSLSPRHRGSRLARAGRQQQGCECKRARFLRGQGEEWGFGRSPSTLLQASGGQAEAGQAPGWAGLGRDGGSGSSSRGPGGPPPCPWAGGKPRLGAASSVFCGGRFPAPVLVRLGHGEGLLVTPGTCGWPPRPSLLSLVFLARRPFQD